MNSNFSKSKEKKIFEEGEKIYFISQNSHEKCAKLHKIENWAEVFYYLKEGKIKERYIELMKCSEYTLFFEGLNYEYGINNYPLNLKKHSKYIKKQLIILLIQCLCSDSIIYIKMNLKNLISQKEIEFMKNFIFLNVIHS